MRYTQIRAKVIRDNTGIAMELPVIMTDYGPLHSLIDYLLHHFHSKSPAWRQKVVQAVGLLLDYIAANHDCFEDPKELFTSFVQRLYSGTIGENGVDPSGLYWLPRERGLVRQLSSQVAAFSDWLSEQKGTEPLNSWRSATTFEQMLNWAAFHQRHSRAFLGHAWDMNKASETAQRARNTLLKRSPKIEPEGVKYFPEDKFEDLVFKGFIVPGQQKSPRIEDRLNLRDILITLLQHYGGLRISEAFHLFVHDVLPDPRDPEGALVRIFHPSEGIAPDDWLDEKGHPIKCTRGTYLRGKYLLIPRNEYPQGDLKHAGWKGPLLDSRQKFMYVNWFPTWAGKVFLMLWNIYLIQRAVLECRHPYAFASKTGTVYSIYAYKKAHARAVRRIGLVPAKMYGTTPHGHRHAYGQRMSEADIDLFIRKVALHHKSLESQSVYTRPTIEKVTDALTKATSTLTRGECLKPPDFMGWTEEFQK